MIRVENVYKAYKSTFVLHDITCHIGSGIYGLIGENGAGKTTFMKLLLGQEKPTKGDIYYGESPEDIKGNRNRTIGYLPQDFIFFDDLTVYESLQYIEKLKGADNNNPNAAIDYWLEYTNMYQYRTKKIKELSGGMRQRLGIIQAFLGNPDIVVLDEPTVGLDPKERIAFRNMINEISENKIIILSTHIISDVSSTCDHLLVLKEGNMLYSGEVDSFINTADKNLYAAEICKKSLSEFTKLHSVISIRRTDHENVEVRYYGDNTPGLQEKDRRKVSCTLEDAYYYHTCLTEKS